jgi:serine/threonine protein kinase
MCRSASTPSYSAPSYTTPTYTYPTYTTPITTPTYSARNTGIVAYTTYSCDYYIVQTTLGYSLLEWFGGRTPSKGDKIYGELNRFGFKDLVIGSSKVKTRAWIEDYMLTDKSVVEKFLKKCK